MGLSAVTALGFPELGTSDWAAYEELAVALATDPVRLRELRRGLSAARATAPLFDTHRCHSRAALAAVPPLLPSARPPPRAATPQRRNLPQIALPARVRWACTRWVQDWERLLHAIVEEPYLPPRLHPCTGALRRFVNAPAESACARGGGSWRARSCSASGQTGLAVCPAVPLARPLAPMRTSARDLAPRRSVAARRVATALRLRSLNTVRPPLRLSVGCRLHVCCRCVFLLYRLRPLLPPPHGLRRCHRCRRAAPLPRPHPPIHPPDRPHLSGPPDCCRAPIATA